MVTMDSRVREVNRVVKGYDRDLVAQREGNGAIHIYRKTENPADPLHFVTALTDTWTVRGTPRDWGLEVLHDRLVAHDLWKNETIMERIMAKTQKNEESRERSRKNNTEAFLQEFRRQFARATDGINTSSLAKIDRRALKGA